MFLDKIALLRKLKSYFNSVTLSEAIFKKEQNNNDFVFLQIGANDGKSQDPIHQFNNKWTGHFIEPLEKPFTALKANYKAQSNKHYYNQAIGKTNGETEIHVPIEETDFNTKIASLNKGGGLLGDFETKALNVKVNRLDDFLEQNSIKHFDLMLLDVEGYELNILMDYSFKIKPKYIFAETRFFSFNDLVVFYERMRKLGYAIFQENDNTLLIKL